MKNKCFVIGLKIFFIILVISTIKVAYAAKTTKLKDEVSVKAVKPFDKFPFDETLEKIPNNYLGHDARLIWKALLKRPIKGEYETTAEYSNRFNDWGKTPLYGQFHIGDRTAFQTNFISAFKSTYDADSEKMSIKLQYTFSPATVVIPGETTLYPYLRKETKTLDRPPMKGTTVMGVKFSYTRSSISEFGVWLDDVSNYRTWEFDAPREKAKESLWWGVIFVGNLSDPYVRDDEFNFSPTLQDQIELSIKSSGIVFTTDELWIYHQKTGEVITKIQLDK